MTTMTMMTTKMKMMRIIKILLIGQNHEDRETERQADGDTERET